MKNGTQPGILISDLISGDGPHLDLANHFLVRRCDVCGEEVTGQIGTQDHRSSEACGGGAAALVGA